MSTTYAILDYVEKINEATKTNNVVKTKKLMQDLEIKQYIPYGQKVTYVKKVINDICIDDMDVKLDSPKRYLAYALSLATLYSNLVCEADDSTLEYDALRKSGLLTEIIKEIGDEEITEFKTVWKMCYEDLLQNELSLPSVIRKNVSRFAFICDEGLTKIAEAIQKIPEKDVEKFTSAIKEKAKNFSIVK